MGQLDGVSIRARRPRVERGKRSKNGCATCLSKKVKCDEQRPCCGRCARLRLPCEWSPDRPSLASRRRGLGPIKRRDSGLWTPSSIVPRESVDRVSEAGLALPDQDITVDCPRPEDIQTMDQGRELDIHESRSPPRDVETALLRDQYIPSNPLRILRVPSWDPIFSTTELTFAQAAGTAPAIGTNDAQALSFHRAVFSPLKSTRDWTCSAQTLFLSRAFDKKMALHFLLAVSHSELAIYYGHGSQPPRESRSHFEKGSQLLFQAQNPFAPTDHVSMMLSFLFMYMFWMRRDRLDPPKLRDLSITTLVYMSKHRLDDICTSNLLPTESPGPLSPSDQALLARILTYLYDRDGFCCFFGCGGSFARHLTNDPDKRRKIWMRSRTIFCQPWSGLHNGNASVQEIEDAAVLDVYFDLIALHQEINCYSQGSDRQSADLEPKLRQRLRTVQQDQSLLFQLVANPIGDQPVSLMTSVTVTFFYALQIYFHRSRSSAFATMPVPLEIQTALSSLMSAAFRTIKTGPVQLLERFQWSLFIAGLETHDAIHREWIVNHISDSGINDGLELLLQKRRSGQCITMGELRNLIGRSQ